MANHQFTKTFHFSFFILFPVYVALETKENSTVLFLSESDEKDFTSRKSKVDEMEKSLTNFKKAFESSSASLPVSPSPPEKRQVNLEELEEVNPDEIKKENERRLAQQNKQLEKIIDSAETLQKHQNDISMELQTQNNNLDNLNAKVDRTNEKMENTQGKLNKLLANSSNNCLYVTNIILFVILIILVLIFFFA